jgi:hypothetical protein
MKTADLINHFSVQTTLPVDVNDVLSCLRLNGIDDEIEFIGVELDPDILQGQIKIFYVRDGLYGDARRYANIYYHRGHDLAWQRLVCCKELIHLLDPHSAETTSMNAISALAEKIGLPPEMQEAAKDGLAVNIDRLAEFRAVAILFPWTARETLMPYFKSGAVNLDDIARLVDIPRKYAAFVMHDAWEKFYPLISVL